MFSGFVLYPYFTINGIDFQYIFEINYNQKFPVLFVANYHKLPIWFGEREQIFVETEERNTSEGQVNR